MSGLAGDYDNPFGAAIIGGGCAGLYCGWRLRVDAAVESVAVFEADSRVGGRLRSVRLPGVQNRMAELGGMRFLPDTHMLVNGLVQHFGLAVEPFRFPDRFRFLRSERFLNGTKPTGYDLAGAASDSPIDVMRGAICAALKEIHFPRVPRDIHAGDPTAAFASIMSTLHALTPEHTEIKCLTAPQWRLLQRFGHLHDRPLYGVGFWNLLQHYLHSDEFLYVHDSLGYQSLVANSNAAQAVPGLLAEFDVHPEDYRTLALGMDVLPKTLSEQFRTSGGLLLHQKAMSIRRVSTRRGTIFQLKTSHRDRDGRFREMDHFAEHVILALPKEAARAIAFIDFPQHETERFQQLSEKVTAHAAFKMFMTFDKPWWRHVPGEGSFRFDFANGRATTDLPIRQVYYMSRPQPGDDDFDRPAGTHDPDGAMVMASYSDDHYVDFWDPLVNDPRRDVHLHVPGCPLSDDEFHSLSEYLATEQLVRKVQRQLARVHGYVNGRQVDEHIVPQPNLAVVKEWPQAWHFWNVHTQPWADIESLAKPFGPETAIYLCGEAFSLEQGWVEGALKSAELALERVSTASRTASGTAASAGVGYPGFVQEPPQGWHNYVRS